MIRRKCHQCHREPFGKPRGELLRAFKTNGQVVIKNCTGGSRRCSEGRNGMYGAKTEKEEIRLVQGKDDMLSK